MKEAISTNKAPGAIGPYSQAIKAGDALYVSGQIPVNPETGAIGETIEEQAAQSLTNLKNILEANGMTTDNVVKTTVFITDLNDFAKVNEIYAKFFYAPFPARSCIEISKIPQGCKIEIECIAVK